jgi:hypothetical protein
MPHQMTACLGRADRPSILWAVALLALTAAGSSVPVSVGAQVPALPLEIHHIHGLALDRRDPEVLYVATHTGLVRLRPNGGPEWVGALFDLMGFTVPPGGSDVIYASGHPDLPTYHEQKVGNLGLLVSRDGGRTWRSVAMRGNADFHALAYSPGHGGELYGWNVAERPGLYRIATAGWVAEAVPAIGLADVLSLAASPHPDGPLLAATKVGLFGSRDRGATWTRVGGIPAAPVLAVSYHAADGRLVYASMAQPGHGFLRSRDAGGTWEATGLVTPSGRVTVALAVGPGDHVVVATSKADIFRSRDGGRSWKAVLEQGRPVTGGR